MNKALAIIGPTASGKTKLAVEIAERLNGEIISADSRQIYKGIPIATAQPDAEDLKRVKHYFIGELDLNEEFNAGEFGIDGRKIINDIFKRGKLPVIAGGSGLYINSLIDGFFESDAKSDEVRERLYNELEKFGENYLYEQLEIADKETFDKIPKGKIRRVIRALEVFIITGKKISELQKDKVRINFETIQFGLSPDRKILYDRINGRVDEMIGLGLIDEVKNLLDSGYHYKKNYSLDTVGIKEVIMHLEGEFDFERMKELIKQNSRRYAKRQMTWFRRDSRINNIETDNRTMEELINEISNKFQKS
ncbi:MAG: tRNA (adenosine(37)-N6)-dimethylallyltransferase MiaA [Ignavibacteria bacterium]|nr:tRNA (adenosine(37)-N6)-dimethylallyltransferase MiaA [Ignavibacteria bacterium]